MSAQPQYLLDANIFIEAKQRYYQFDVCPGFWDWLLWHCAGGQCCSVDHVRNELLKINDDLAEWVKNNVNRQAFHDTTAPATTTAYAAVMQWVNGNPQFKVEAQSQFAAGADGWLVAYAMVNDRVLVTHEVHEPAARKRVPIPNVCRQFGVPYQNGFEMLKDLQAKFEWRQPAGADLP